jgi:hypothetical protein
MVNASLLTGLVILIVVGLIVWRFPAQTPGGRTMRRKRRPAEDLMPPVDQRSLRNRKRRRG